MIESETIEIKTEEVRTKIAFCDYCGKEFDERTIMCNGFGSIHFYFGFGSCFDSSGFNLEICDSCFIEEFAPKLEKQLKEKDFNIDKIKDAMNNKEFSNNIK